MKKTELIDRINSGQIKMRPRWQFVVIKWTEVLTWVASVATVVCSSTFIAYFLTIYDIRELSEFGDLGWQIFYEDFPYLWGVTAILFLVLGTLVLLRTGSGYKRSWQKNMMITSMVILLTTILILFLER